MERKTLILVSIPITGVLVVANLLYFWLAPDVVCKMLVYWFCLGVILLQGVASVLLWHFCGPQKATPVVVSGSAFALGVLAAGGLMLSLDAPHRTSLFFLIIFSVLYLICVAYLSCMAADDLWNRVENSVVTLPTPRQTVSDWLTSLRATFSRRRRGESDAEYHVRTRRNQHSNPGPETTQTPPAPPPLPPRF